ncbi:hypothetical protein [Aeromonas salmonicida]|uniref:hypothetical protein n=1 Tax=Aeromonas salmonicida TaxID=645 RepID=UPI00232E8EF0|nr:hypothetical protein [Aeromonas salmonicida]WCH28841.1 hypothetical protein ONZ66_08605 [Aeromonas salmonicida]
MDAQLSLYMLKSSIDYFLIRISQDGYKQVVIIGLGVEKNPEVVDYLTEKLKGLKKSIDNGVLTTTFVPEGLKVNPEQELIINGVGCQAINLCVDILDELLSNPQIFLNSDNDFLKSYLSYMSAVLNGSYNSISSAAHSYPTSKVHLAYSDEFKRLVNEYKFIKRRNIEWLIQSGSTAILTKSLDSYFSSREKELAELKLSIQDALLSEKNEINNKSKEMDFIAKKFQSDFEKNKVEMDSLAHKLQSVFDKNSADYSELLNEMEGGINSIKERGIEIEGILQMANQHGMASSFQKRVKELMLPRLGWLAAFAVSIISLVTISYYIIIPESSNGGEFSWPLLFKHIPITLPVIWAAWFSSKQYTQMSKLKEDYEYKYAVAMAYHGYKKEAMELNSEMHTRLLDSILVHFSENPVRLYSSIDSTTPVEALLKNDKLSDLIKSIKG